MKWFLTDFQETFDVQVRSLICFASIECSYSNE